MIKVNGEATYKVPFVLQIDMTEEEWDNLSDRRQDEIIDEMIGHDEMRNAEKDEVDIWDVIEIKEAQQ